MRDAMDGALLDRKERKALAKSRKKEAKAAAKTRRAARSRENASMCSTFKGDMRASAVKRLGAEIDAVLIAARPGTDETVIRIESPGGTVTGYGLAAAEILRLRDRKIKVTASVDQVAASGGYMMACAADRIVAAPFAIVGSIGVVAPVPNLHRLLKKNEIDFEEITAGEFKRTVSVLGEITPAGREHFREKLDTTHEAFKAHVAQCRPNVDIARVANGDYWLAREGLALGLVDEIMTGDDLLFRARDSARLYEVSTEARKTLLQQLLSGIGGAAQKAMDLADAVIARLVAATALVTPSLELVAIDDRARIARHVVKNAALDERVHARVAEQDERRAIVVAARVARDLPPLREQLADRQRRLSAAATPDAASIVARQRPERISSFPHLAPSVLSLIASRGFSQVNLTRRPTNAATRSKFDRAT